MIKVIYRKRGFLAEPKSRFLYKSFSEVRVIHSRCHTCRWQLFLFLWIPRRRLLKHGLEIQGNHILRLHWWAHYWWGEGASSYVKWVWMMTLNYWRHGSDADNFGTDLLRGWSSLKSNTDAKNHILLPWLMERHWFAWCLSDWLRHKPYLRQDEFLQEVSSRSRLYFEGGVLLWENKLFFPNFSL